jgi:hypothetical protein
MKWIKGKVRRFAVWLRYTTDAWVVPHSLWLLADSQPTKALEELERIRAVYPDDPEITYAATAISFLARDG